MNYTLHDLNLHIRQVIALNFREPVWITAEIAESSLSRGHLYLSLIQKIAETAVSLGDESIIAQAQAVVWQRDRRRLAKTYGHVAELALSAGVQARLCVRVDYHERYGIKLHIEDIDPSFSMGILAMERLKTLENLQKGGLLERNQRLVLPAVVQRIAVVTSPDAAGFHDFKAHLAQNTFGYAFHYQCFFAAVQGRNAVPEIVAALNQIGQMHTRFDAVVLVRGGGARLDLAVFDSEAVAKAVSMAPLPVLSGIGHETDTSVLDMVAHSAFKTPTAVADFLLERALRFESQLLELSAQMAALGQRVVRYAAESLQMTQHTVTHTAQHNVQTAAAQLTAATRETTYLSRQVCQNQQRALLQMEQLVEALSPQTTLQRGYTLTSKNGTIVRSIAELSAGDVVDTLLADGTTRSVVL